MDLKAGYGTSDRFGGVVRGARRFAAVSRLRMTRRVTDTSNLGHAGALMLGVLLSFVILFLGAIACVVLARDLAVPFVLAEAAVLVACAIGYGVYTFVRK